MARNCQWWYMIGCLLSRVKNTQPHVSTSLWSKDMQNIGLAKRLLGYCFWLLGSGLTAASDDIIKAACQYEWYKSTPMSLWHSDWKIHLFGFGLLGSSIMVARVWQGSVSGGTWLVVCCPESKTPGPMSLQHCDVKISIWRFIMAVYVISC